MHDKGRSHQQIPGPLLARLEFSAYTAYSHRTARRRPMLAIASFIIRYSDWYALLKIEGIIRRKGIYQVRLVKLPTRGLLGRFGPAVQLTDCVIRLKKPSLAHYIQQRRSGSNWRSFTAVPTDDVDD
jgi:hypothetical protein